MFNTSDLNTAPNPAVRADVVTSPDPGCGGSTDAAAAVDDEAGCSIGWLPLAHPATAANTTEPTIQTAYRRLRDVCAAPACTLLPFGACALRAPGPRALIT